MFVSTFDSDIFPSNSPCTLALQNVFPVTAERTTASLKGKFLGLNRRCIGDGWCIPQRTTTALFVFEERRRRVSKWRLVPTTAAFGSSKQRRDIAKIVTSLRGFPYVWQSFGTAVTQLKIRYQQHSLACRLARHGESQSRFDPQYPVTNDVL